MSGFAIRTSKLGNAVSIGIIIILLTVIAKIPMGNMLYMKVLWVDYRRITDAYCIGVDGKLIYILFFIETSSENRDIRTSWFAFKRLICYLFTEKIQKVLHYVDCDAGFSQLYLFIPCMY